MTKGTTQSGFKYEISEARLENYELLEVIAEVDDNPLLLPKLLKMLLGQKQADNLKNYLRDEEGLVSTQRLMDEVKSIFTQTSIKN